MLRLWSVTTENFKKVEPQFGETSMPHSKQLKYSKKTWVFQIIGFYFFFDEKLERKSDL